MKSVKPGRGSSFMGGIMGIAMGLFGILWMVVVVVMGGGIFAAFGAIFVIMAIVTAVYNFKNASSKNRYSSFDITDNREEPDPFNEKYGNSAEIFDDENSGDTGSDDAGFCPYCGAKVEGDYEYCRKCGKKIS